MAATSVPRSREDDKCSVKEGKVPAKGGLAELELVWFSPEVIPLQLVPPDGETGEHGALLLAVLLQDNYKGQHAGSPLRLLRSGDVVRTVWLPGAPLAVSGNSMSFAAILRATMEGGSLEQPLILTFGPPAQRPWEPPGQVMPPLRPPR